MQDFFIYNYNSAESEACEPFSLCLNNQMIIFFKMS